MSRAIALFLPLVLCGCFPPQERKLEENKNPYFLEAKARVKARDYRGAIDAFEKALEVNPQSALAHYELGVLYEQHGDQKESDYISAMFHYQQVLKLRADGRYPHDNAKVRIASCKQELVKSESLAPVYYAMERELLKLREENQLLRKQAESFQAQIAAANRPAPQPSVNANVESISANSSGTLVAKSDPPVSRVPTRSSSDSRVTPLPPFGSSRVHVVKDGDTAASIARFYRVRLDSLLRANPSLDPKKMHAGQTLKVPAS